MSTCDCFKGTPANEYKPCGSFTTISGLQVYVSRPQVSKNASVKSRILFLPDGFSLANHNLRLADMYAELGYETTIVDYFEGDGLPDIFMRYTPGTDIDSYDIFTPDQKDIIRNIDMTEWLKRHNPGQVSTLLERFFPGYCRVTTPTTQISTGSSWDTSKIHILGHCFGGKYALRLAKLDNNEIASVLVFHPAFLDPSDTMDIKKPILVGCAESDVFTPSLMKDMISQLPKCGAMYKFLVYGGTKHGFSSRQDPEDKVATEMFSQAFDDGLRWMQAISKLEAKS